jgi:aldehyde dehydrogenase (NAD+)
MSHVIPVDKERHRLLAASLPKPHLMIGDERRATGRAGVFPHVNAATGEIQGETPLGDAQDIDDAVSAARAAFPLWRDLRPYDRRKAMDRFADLLEANIERFADIAVLENGIPRGNFMRGMAATTPAGPTRSRAWSRA